LRRRVRRRNWSRRKDNSFCYAHLRITGIMCNSRLCAASWGVGVGWLHRQAQFLFQGTRTSHNRWSPDVGISDARRPSWKMEQQFTRRCAHA
jgi:hypothetical protein